MTALILIAIRKEYGMPGSIYEGNLNNSIFALWTDLNTENYGNPSNNNNFFNIRTLWNEETQIFTVGWYRINAGDKSNNDGEANFEVQFDLANDSFNIVHGTIGSNQFSSGVYNNIFVGFSKDLSCMTTTEDISSCEGKDYVQLRFHDSHSGPFTDSSGSEDSFQNPNGNNQALYNNHMFNSYFSGNQTINKTSYCDTKSINGPCETDELSYDDFVGGTDGDLYTVSKNPVGNDFTNVLLPSDIKQSFRAGLNSEFVWMHLNKYSSSLSYRPPEDSASGFVSGPNSKTGIDGGLLVAGSNVNETTFSDEIIIAGEVYKNKQLESFLSNQKKVVAYAPIPIIHTNKYEKAEFSGFSDERFKRTHTLMPHFLSSDFMEDKDDGTDANFDFHQLVDEDYGKGNTSQITYSTSGGLSFDNQDSFALSKTDVHADGMYAYASKALDENIHISSERFGDLLDTDDLVPRGQSLWYQVFNPNGRGVGLFAQINWSCGSMTKCGSPDPRRSTPEVNKGPHETQQSFFSVLIADVGDKKDFYKDGNYPFSLSGPVIQGDHYWSYMRRSDRTVQKDGIYATESSSPQITFGINPISCISGPDNGCFFGDNEDFSSNNNSAPSTAIISTDDPCGNTKELIDCSQGGHGTMDLGVMYSMSENNSEISDNLVYKTETFYQGITKQKQYDGSQYVDSINLEGQNSWRSYITSSANTWTGRFQDFYNRYANRITKKHPQYP